MFYLSGDVLGFYKTLAIPIAVVVLFVIFILFVIISNSKIYKTSIGNKPIPVKAALTVMMVSAFLILFVVVGWGCAYVLSQ